MQSSTEANLYSLFTKRILKDGVANFFTELFGLNIQPKTDYADSDWFNKGIRRITTINHHGHVTSTVTVNRDFNYGSDSEFKAKYLGNLMQERMQKTIMEQAAHIEEQSKISIEGEEGSRIFTYSFPFCLIPKDPQLIFLAAPNHIETVIPEELAQAYQININLRFRYEIIDSKFIVSGEWSSIDDNETWSVFSIKEYAYEPLFYQGAEAVFNYWYGGNMPTSLTANSKIMIWHSGGASVNVTRLEDYVYIPLFSERMGAIKQDFREIPEVFVQGTPVSESNTKQTSSPSQIGVFSRKMTAVTEINNTASLGEDEKISADGEFYTDDSFQKLLS